MKVYMSQKWMSEKSKTTVVLFYQLLRISNTMNYHLRLLNDYLKADIKTQLFILIEESCIISSIIKEATKVIFSEKSIADMNNLLLSDEAKTQFSDLTKYYMNFNSEVNLIILEHIRNNIQYHFKSSIFNEFVLDGKQEKQIILCESDDNSFSKTIFNCPINISINSIETLMEKHGILGNPIINLIDLVNIETKRLYEFLYLVIYDIVNKVFLKTAF